MQTTPTRKPMTETSRAYRQELVSRSLTETHDADAPPAADIETLTAEEVAALTAAATRTAGSTAGVEARRTAADVLNLSLHARFVAVARMAVALALVDGGADEFASLHDGDPYRFPEGSDYGALCAQDDLSTEQADAIFQAAGEAVRAEAAHMMQSASPKMAAAIAAQLARWEEGAAIERENMKEIREALDRDEEEMKEAEEPSPEKRYEERHSAGRQYVLSYLTEDVGNRTDARWLIESIGAGYLRACPRCHFLHLPSPPFSLTRRSPVPVDACDVCAAVPMLCDPINWGDGWEDGLPTGLADLADARTARAITLYDLWIGATDGADALRVAAIAESMNALRAGSRSEAGESLVPDRRAAIS